MPERTLDWWFDFISPYAYLQSERLSRIEHEAGVTLRPRPLLFAGLLDHHGQKGPAEIPSKREHTYRQVLWIAHRDGIALRLPPAHPFNPLPLLRLFVAAGGTREALHLLFRFVWRDGRLPDEAGVLDELGRALGVPDVAAALAREDVKAVLRDNGREALARGVFGVPTLDAGDALFWGDDTTDFALAHLRGDAFATGESLRAAGRLPVGSARRAVRE